MYIIYFIRHLSTFVNSRLFSLDSRLFSLDSRLFLSTLSLDRSTFGFILLKLQRWIIEICAYEKRFKCHKWQHWIVGSWKWRCEIYIDAPCTTFGIDCKIEYTLGWPFKDWFQRGFVLNFQRRRVFLYGEVILFTEDVCISKEYCIFSRKSDTFYGQATCYCRKWVTPCTVVLKPVLHS